MRISSLQIILFIWIGLMALKFAGLTAMSWWLVAFFPFIATFIVYISIFLFVFIFSVGAAILFGYKR